MPITFQILVMVVTFVKYSSAERDKLKVRKWQSTTSMSACNHCTFFLLKVGLTLLAEDRIEACCRHRRRNLQTQQQQQFGHCWQATSYRTTLIQLDSMRATSASLARTPRAAAAEAVVVVVPNAEHHSNSRLSKTNVWPV